MNSSCESLYLTLPANKLIFKFERMEQSQKLTFQSNCYKNVASPPDEDFPNTVLLFEPRICYPALRVTPNEIFIQNQAIFWLQPEIFNEIHVKSIFSLFFQFFENCAPYVRIFDLFFLQGGVSLSNKSQF